MVSDDCHFGVDVEEGFTLASLIMRNSDLFLGNHDRVRLLVFGFSQLLTLRKRRPYDVGFEVVRVRLPPAPSGHPSVPHSVRTYCSKNPLLSICPRSRFNSEARSAFVILFSG
jgi:hypothetical protein